MGLSVGGEVVALKMMKEMAASYGCDISRPAANVQEAIQAVYFGYLCAVKEQNGAAMSLGRTHLRDHGPAVHAYAAQGLGHPYGIACEDLVVLRRAGELDAAQLHA